MAIVAKSLKVAIALTSRRWRIALLGHRVLAGVEHRKVLGQLGKIRSIVDVGANRGQFALVAHDCFPEASITSFEPLAEPAARFRSLFRNSVKVHLQETAIGLGKGETTIHISARDDSSSLLPIGRAQSTVFPGTAEIGTATIDVAPLGACLRADEIDDPALLKLDVQGYELQALKGCEELLNLFAWVYVECSFVELYEGQSSADEVIAWLRAREFRLHGTYNVSYSAAGRSIQADFLFNREAPLRGAA